jgi:phospholipid/cholesterol/gamma-HCH transport system ATP-binding protein
MQTPLIEFRNVSKRFDDHTVLDNVNLEIFENQITTIIGKSGTGKSVLLKHIIGLLSPDEGTILFRGKPVHEMKKAEWDVYRSRISYMFQNNALFDSLTVFENIALPLRQTTNLRNREIMRKVMMRAQQTELFDAIRKYPAELSGGMQKRVALARALVTDPAIVLFDEPTTGQDPIRKNTILSMIAHYRRQFGFTAILISHDIPDVFFISDRIILLWDGTVAFQGSYEESTQLNHPMIDEFMRSLEGFQDKLTGLLSKQVFKTRYAMTFHRGHIDATVSAILFTVGVDLHAESYDAPLFETLRILGENINDYFAPLGGFSARHGRSQILTVLPRVPIADAGGLLDSFAELLQERALPEIEEMVQRSVGDDRCFTIFIKAGIMEGSSSEDLDALMSRAGSNQRTVAVYNCERGGRAA